ncbi:DivIVA domain-containing protein [Arthrobacter woluwensis]|uniref:DivIVA domain-containing protein n=1 Tax=Arthrobacter woluwensis TaxID=156980 RepID=UPI00278AEDED|nr:DivIVA domain-containing protein [Arthrobacter woluwensis]MDQ0709484.1 DivIVA domain-containing protein [Arthrobacter woluwensis]
MVLGAAFVMATPLLRRIKVGGRSVTAPDLEDGFEEPAANLPAVLLPERPTPADVDRLRFSLGLRGYRMDQVDEVLDRLRDQLAVQQSELSRLRGRIAELTAGGAVVGPAGDDQPHE